MQLPFCAENFGGGVVDTDHYGIPCRLLPTADTLWVKAELPAPGKIDGTILISAGDLSGFEFGPGSLNPYEQFKSIKPTAVIDYGAFVYEGHFEIPRAAAIWHTQKARGLLFKKEYGEAPAEAQKAQSLAPDAVNPLFSWGFAARGRRWAWIQGASGAFQPARREDFAAGSRGLRLWEERLHVRTAIGCYASGQAGLAKTHSNWYTAARFVHSFPG